MCYFVSVHKFISIWASVGENWSSRFVNNKGADQPAHPHRLISTFIIPLFKTIIPLFKTIIFKVAIFILFI